MLTRVALGLIGDNIRASRSPDLHRFCGTLTGLDVSYDLFIPHEMGLGFDEVFEHCRAAGLAGVNVTLPYKERVVPKLRIDDPLTRAIGACNTVLFTDRGPVGHNTDYSGFVSAFRAALGGRDPGQVVMFGAGGVGKAIAFGLIVLGASEVVIVDPDAGKAGRLADALTAAGGGTTVGRVGDLGSLSEAHGVVNATPLGMVGYPGSPVPEGAFPRGGWAFDAVYTPIDTPFRRQALDNGTEFISGYELFFHQGIDCFELFTGRRVADEAALRRLLDRAAQDRGSPAA